MQAEPFWASAWAGYCDVHITVDFLGIQVIWEATLRRKRRHDAIGTAVWGKLAFTRND
jgi:hypothetical protein